MRNLAFKKPWREKAAKLRWTERMLSSLRRIFRPEFFAIDARALAVTRVVLGLTVFGDVASRFSDLRAHYTDWGIVSTAWARHHPLGFFPVSVHNLSGAESYQLALLALTLLSAFFVAVGFRTRIFVLLCWYLMVSLHERNPLVLNSGDDLLRDLLFWSCFLPMGKVLSVDSDMNSSSRPRKEILSWATACLLLQSAFVYIFLILHKTGTAWWGHGTAVALTLHNGQLTTALGRWVGMFPHGLLVGLTYTTLVCQAAGPYLLFSPFATARFRTVVTLLLIGFQVGFGMCLQLGCFPYAATAALIPFLPSSFWDFLERRARPFLRRWKSTRARRLFRLRPETPFMGKWASGFCIVMLISVFATNLRELGSKRLEFLKPLTYPSRLFTVRQPWTMFSPNPPNSDGWLMAVTTLSDGTQVDIHNENGGYEVSYTPPVYSGAMYANHRWQKYLMNLERGKAPAQSYARFLCRTWNESHPSPKDAVFVELIYRKYRLMRGPGRWAAESQSLWKGDCSRAGI